MNMRERVLVLASVITCFLLQAQGADKYTDGNRPYEFGFSIDGEQHRHEKKDEKGLIQGEFGFITADGVYHVTVYATDEQGRFKIISMKNIRVKPYPTYTAKQSSTSARQGHSLEQPASVSLQSPSVSPPVTTTTLKSISIEPPASSCSHCSIPTTSTVAPAILAPAVPSVNQQIGSNANIFGDRGNPKFSQGVKPQSDFVAQTVGANQSPQQSLDSGTPQRVAPNYPTQPQNSLAQIPTPHQELVPPNSIADRLSTQNEQSFPQQTLSPAQGPAVGLSGPQGNLQGPGSINLVQSPGPVNFPQPQLQTPQESPTVPKTEYPGSVNGENSLNPSLGNLPSGRTAKKLDDEPSIGPVGTQPNSLQRGLTNNQGASTPPAKPTLISAQMQIVDKNTDIHRRGPGENEGLPEGLTKDDMSKLLYTFNYTVGFHGHYEEGYVNGAKQGYYFVTGRNGVRTRVDYIADSKGFRPKISQEVLDLLSDDVPKPETEKEEKYGLKGYEFKWLYYPVEAKGR